MALRVFKPKTHTCWTLMILLSSTVLILSAIVYINALKSQDEISGRESMVYESDYDEDYFETYLHDMVDADVDYTPGTVSFIHL